MTRTRCFILIFLTFMTLYSLTLSPGVSWGDSAKLSSLSMHLNFNYFAGAHPLHNIVGYIANHIVPFGDTAFKQNLVSAFFGAISVGLLFILLRVLSVSVLSSIVSSSMFGLSHIQWHVSVITESYTLTISLFLLACILALLWLQTLGRRYLYLLSIVIGLGYANFLLFLPFALIFFVMIVIKTRKSLSLGIAGTSSLCFIAGYAIVLVPFLIDGFKIGFPTATRDLLDLTYSGHLFIYKPVEAVNGVLMYFPYLAYQFPSLSIIFGGIGVYAAYRMNRAFFLVSLSIFAMIILFTSTYMEQRKFYIMSVSFTIYAIWIGYGIDRLLTRNFSHRLTGLLISLCLVMPPIVYQLTPFALRSAGIEFVVGRTVPYRDNQSYFLRPAKNGETSAIRFSNEVLDGVKPKAIVFADFTPLSVLHYSLKERAVSPDDEDVIIVAPSRSGEKFVEWLKSCDSEGYDIFFADVLPDAYHMDVVEKHFIVVKDGKLPLYRVTPKK